MPHAMPSRMKMIPLPGRGKGREALGWVVEQKATPTPARRDCCRFGEGFSLKPSPPPMEGIFRSVH